MRDKHQFLLEDDEIHPQHCVCHKGHITMVMFLCAVAHPCYNTATISWWDGGKQLNGNNLIMNVALLFGKTKAEHKMFTEI